MIFSEVLPADVFMKSIAKDDLSAMIQANVDALAEFEWNGNHGTKTPIIGLVNVGYLR